MHSLSRDDVRDRIPAFGLAAVLQVAAVWVIIHSLVTPQPHEDAKSGTQIIFLPTLPPVLPARPKPRQAQGSGAAAPYFNPYTFHSEGLAAPSRQGLAFALSACDVGRYDMAPDEIRTACDRIGALIKHDPGHFGYTSEVADPRHWQRELARREAPFLMVCAKPKAPVNQDVVKPPRNADMLVGVDLATLLCVYDLLAHPYDPEKRNRYGE